MNKFILATALIIGGLGSVEAKADDGPPKWSVILGAINCHNAAYERHYVPNAGLETTVCKFGNGDLYIFLTLDEDRETRCQVFSENKNHVECTKPVEVQ